MATYQPARRRTRKIRRLRLRHIHPGWYIAVPIALYAAARTWPIPFLCTVTAIAALLILNAVRPARLTALLSRLRHLTGRRTQNLTHKTLTRYQKMPPTRFEQAIADLATRDEAVHSATPQGGANDRGADVLVHMHDGRRILIQCKRYTGKNKVTSDDVQKVNGTWRDIHRCDAAVIVTTTGFTRSALETNAMLRTRLRLVDGNNLALWTHGGPSPLG